MDDTTAETFMTLALLGLPLLSVICLIVGVAKRLRISLPLLLTSLLAPLFFAAWTALDPSLFGHGAAPYSGSQLHYGFLIGGLAASALLVAGYVGAKKGWRVAPVAAWLGLLLPALPAVYWLILVFSLGSD